MFPDARIVYVERDAARCIDSNYRRTLNRESLKPSIVLRKYLSPKRGEGDFGAHLDATGGRALHEQVRPRDWLPFSAYTARLLWLRQTKGPLAYHVEVYRIAQDRKARFESLYGDRMASFRLEALQSDPAEIERLFAFCDFAVDRSSIDEIITGFDQDLVSRASRPGPDDDEINRLLKAQGVT